MAAPPDVPTRSRLPTGFAAKLRPDLLRNTSDLLVGGSPLRALRLSPAAKTYISGDRLVIRDPVSAEVAARLIDGNLADPEPHGPAVTIPEMTVVIPVRDRAAQLDRCLTALSPLKCVVVDDASEDGVPIGQISQSHSAELLRLEVNAGPAAARNAGLAVVTTEYVAFVDSDVEVLAGELLGLATHFADERVALVGPLVAGVSRSLRPRWFERYDTAASSLDLGHVGARVSPGAHVAWLPSACLVGRAAMLRAAGGFDPGMRVGEDVDLVWRLVQAGLVVRYDPSRAARHDTRATLRTWMGRKFVYGTGGADLAARHGSATAPAVLSLTTAVGAAAVLARRPWSLPIVAIALARSVRSLNQNLPRSSRRGIPLTLDVAVRGLGWGVRQESALLLRHWWPATVLACIVSSSARRAVASALVVDLFVSSRQPTTVNPATAFAGRRLDDLAYGSGLWVGALRRRSVTCLKPRRAQEVAGFISCPATSETAGQRP